MNNWMKYSSLLILLVLVLTLVGCVQYKTPVEIDTLKTQGIEAQVIQEPKEIKEIQPVEKISTPIETNTPIEIKQPEEKTTQEIAKNANIELNNEPSKKVSSQTPIKKVNEGQLVSFPNLNAFDADGDKIEYQFTKPLNENGEWQTQIGDAGEYLVTITASDKKSKVSQDVLIVVNSSNNPPNLEGLSDITVSEGQVITLNPITSDSDGDRVNLVYSGWMKSADYKTKRGDAGNYYVTVTASDGYATVSKTIKIKVTARNYPPLVQDLKDIVVNEGEKATINVIAADPEGMIVTTKFDNSKFDGNGVWQTKKGDKGEYTITVTVSDGELYTIKTLKVLVKEINLAPVLETITNINIKEGEYAIISVKAADPEGKQLTTTFSGWMNTDRKKADYNSAGVHFIKVIVSDGENEVSQDVKITVEDVNQPPVFDSSSFN